MMKAKLPQTDSIEELARFWDAHEVTDFEDELEEVTEPVFLRSSKTTMALRLEPQEQEAVRRLAQARGVADSDLVREWVLERLREA
jgi:hypothetical protein